MTEIKLVHTDSLSCETIFRIAPNGDYFIISQCGGNAEPAPENRVLFFRSTDKGQTWQKGIDINPEEKRANYCTEVFVHGGVIKAYLTVHTGYFSGYENYIAKSSDSGFTWQIEKDNTFEDFHFMRSGFMLSDGRYMTVAQLYPDTAKDNQRLSENKEYIWKSDSPCTLNTVVYNDGKGGLGGSVSMPREYNGARLWKWSEPTAIELEKGHIVMLLRFQATDYLWRADSYDYGKTWSELEKTEFENPGNKPKLIKAGNKVILLNTFNKGVRYIDRSPLSVWVSYDGMKTWAKKIVAVDFPAWLSYPDGVFDQSDNKVKFAFEFNRHDVYYVSCDIED